jgi:uncharacterized protein YjbJ (UPF0337 family)
MFPALRARSEPGGSIVAAAGRKRETTIWRVGEVCRGYAISATTRGGRTLMGMDDKLKNKSQDLKGEWKERVGDALDDEEMQAEGKADQTKANLKQAGEKVKDAFKS